MLIDDGPIKYIFNVGSCSTVTKRVNKGNIDDLELGKEVYFIDLRWPSSSNEASVQLPFKIVINHSATCQYCSFQTINIEVECPNTLNNLHLN